MWLREGTWFSASPQPVRPGALPACSPINPPTPGTRPYTHTPTQVWLNNVVEAMRAALSHEFKTAVVAYDEKPRTRWLFDHSVQNTVVVSRAFFTQEVGHCLFLSLVGTGWHLRLPALVARGRDLRCMHVVLFCPRRCCCWWSGCSPLQHQSNPRWLCR